MIVSEKFRVKAWNSSTSLEIKDSTGDFKWFEVSLIFKYLPLFQLNIQRHKPKVDSFNKCKHRGLCCVVQGGLQKVTAVISFHHRTQAFAVVLLVLPFVGHITNTSIRFIQERRRSEWNETCRKEELHTPRVSVQFIIFLRPTLFCFSGLAMHFL